MALQVGSRGALKTLSGLYQGQTSPIVIGADTSNIGPHTVGYTLQEDRISLNAYFDPTQSAAARTGQWDLITYIAVGVFYVNGAPLSVALHDHETPLPTGLGSNTDFVDVPKLNSKGQPNTKPYYPSWAYEANSAVPTANLYKFPQDYGGFTKYNGSPFSNGALLAASMNKSIVLTTGTLPILSANLDGFFRQLDFSELNPGHSFNRDIPLQTDPWVVKQNLITAQQLPDLGDAVETVHFKDGTPEQFLAFRYPTPGPRSSGVQYAYAAWTYAGGNFYPLAQEDVVNFLEDNQEAPLDIPKLQDRIYQNEGLFLFWGGRVDTTISYRFILFPCGIKEDTAQKTIYARPFEGLECTASRQYTSTGWQPPALRFVPGSPAADSEIIWENCVRNFLRNLPGQPYSLGIVVPGRPML